MAEIVGEKAHVSHASTLLWNSVPFIMYLRDWSAQSRKLSQRHGLKFPREGGGSICDSCGRELQKFGTAPSPARFPASSSTKSGNSWHQCYLIAIGVWALGET